jgi:hypothetical protein
VDPRSMSLLLTIFDLYQKLIIGLNTDDDVLHVECIPGFEWARIGVAKQSVFLLLPPEERVTGPDLELEHIRVSPNKSYKIKEVSGFRTETVAVVETKSRDGWLVETFLELISMLFESGVSSNPTAIRKLIQDLVSLFRALTQPNRKSTQGLWGELFLIDKSNDVELAVSSWHTTPNDRYDFARGHERVEVKTTTGPRIHSFSHAQLIPVDGLRVSIASLVLNRTGDGLSCADLALRILPRLRAESSRRSFVDQVVRTLGEDWNTQDSYRFDIDQAHQSLRFFDVDNVPKIVDPIPANVHGVKYQSDLQVIVEMVKSDFGQRDMLSLALYGSE